MVVPRSVSATGVLSLRPAASRSPSALLSVSGVPSTTTVTLSAVERVQSTLVPPLTTGSDGDASDGSGPSSYAGTALTSAASPALHGVSGGTKVDWTRSTAD